MCPILRRAHGRRPPAAGESDSARDEQASEDLQQAERLFHLPEEVCRTMLAKLVEEGFLRIEHDGRFRLLRHG